jgi:hypothetical protein
MGRKSGSDSLKNIQKGDSVKLKVCVLGIMLQVGLAATVSAQGWTKVGGFPTGKVVPATSKNSPTNATPIWRQWNKPVYSPIDGGLLTFLANPACCGGVYTNAVYVYRVGNASPWQMMFSHMTDGRGSHQTITAINRSNGTVTLTLASPLSLPSDPTLDIVIGITNVSDPSFNDTTPILGTLIDPYHLSFQQTGLPNSTPTCSPAANCGLAWGAFSGPDAPADGHQYHLKAWDSSRNILWEGFGTQATCVNSAGVYGGDCGGSDFYKFSTQTGVGVFTQVCGLFTSPCGPGRNQESTLVYDPQADVLIHVAGLYNSTASAQTWEYAPSTNTWTEICTDPGLHVAHPNPCPIPQLDAPGLVYDPDLGASVLFGGLLSAEKGKPLNTTTWLFNSSTNTWTQATTTANPPGVKFPVMDYVPGYGVVLIGYESGGAHVWAFEGDENWHDLGLTGGPNLAASPSFQSFGAYDQKADLFVVFTKNPDVTIWSLKLP